jgi:phosphate acetyltransferase
MVLAVVSAKDMSAAEAADAVDVARRELDAEQVSLLAMMVNRAAEDAVDAIREQVRPGKSGRPVYVIPELSEISQPTMAEVAGALNARHIAGGATLERDVFLDPRCRHERGPLPRAAHRWRAGDCSR